MALEVTSSAVTGLHKIAKPIETAPEQRAIEHTADVSKVSTSAQIERQVTVNVKQDDVNTGSRENSATQAEISHRLQSAVKRANSMRRTSCQFQYHEETNRVSIKVMDKDTNEVIREIPSEEALELIQKMWEMAGILVDETR